MSIRKLEQLYAGLLGVILGGIVLHAPLTVWLGSLFPTQTILIKSWKELLMIPAAALAVYLVTKKKQWGHFGQDIIFKLIILYTGLHLLITLLFYTGLNTTFAGLAIDLRYVLFFGLLYTSVVITPHYRRLYIKVAVAGAIVVSGFGLLQATVLPKDILAHIGYEKNVTISPYLTVDENPDYVRINSTLRGPNPLGAYAASVLVLIAAYLGLKKRVDKKWLLLLVLASAATLWVSYSRGALLAVFVGAGLVALSLYGRTLRARHLFALAVVCLVFMAGLFVLRDSSFVSNVLLHENATTGADISSNEGHVDSLVDGGERILGYPLGAGVGSTGSASLYGGEGLIIENQYLFIAHEVGWLGLGLFLALFAVVLQRLYRARKDWLALGLFASGIGLAVIGLFLPVWADDTVSIVWWGLAGLALAQTGKIKS